MTTETTTMTLTDPDGDRLQVLPARAPKGHVFVRTDDGAGSVTIGAFDPADLIAAIREVAGEADDKPEPAPVYQHVHVGTTPTAEDFAKAEFARHEDGRIAARLDADDSLRWAVQIPTGWADWRSDADMAEERWSIVTPAPSTPREALALAVDLAYEPEGDTMPDQNGYVMVWDEGMINAYSHSNPRGLPVRGTGYRLLLIDPRPP